MERIVTSLLCLRERYSPDVNARRARALINRNIVIRSEPECDERPIRRSGKSDAEAGVRQFLWQNGPMRSTVIGVSRQALLLALVVVVAGCGSSVRPSPQASPTTTSSTESPVDQSPSALPVAESSASAYAASQADLAAFATIESQVRALRGLSAKTPVTPVLLDPKGLTDKLTAINAAETDHAGLAAESRLFIHLGLLPAGSSLEQLELDLDSNQVVGFYDPISKGLYVLSASGGVGTSEEATFSHEYTHALQDQNFGLDKLDNYATGEDDRDLARTSLPEGDAVLASSMWEKQNLSLGDLLRIALDPSVSVSAAQLADAPAILSETLLFPYTQGLTFIEGVYGKGGWAAVNKLYSHPPDSTSQILHPELYTAGVEPVAVTVPAVPASLGSGWTLSYQDTLGELQLIIWLHGAHPSSDESAAASAATSQWGGDRIGLYEGPNGSWAIVLSSTWRTAGGAAAFKAALTTKAQAHSGPIAVCGSGRNVELYVGSDAAALGAFTTC